MTKSNRVDSVLLIEQWKFFNFQYQIIGQNHHNKNPKRARRHKIFDEAQAGFTKGRNCAGQILALETIIETREAQNKPTFCAFLDIKKAFDSVDRNQLFVTMQKVGIDDKTVTMLSRMFEGEISRVLMNGTPTAPIDISKGTYKNCFG